MKKLNILPFEQAKTTYKSAMRSILWVRYRYMANFIFVHIPKTGGTSVERLLFLPQLHDRALTQRDYWFGADAYKARFSFSIVRNPFDLVFSLYNFRLQTNQMPSKSLSFKEWVRMRYLEKYPDYTNTIWYDKPQLWWLEDDNKNIIIDFIGKLENIQEDWLYISSKLRVKNKLPHKNKSGREKSYRNQYDDATAQIVYDVYGRDIDYFGYKF